MSEPGLGSERQRITSGDANGDWGGFPAAMASGDAVRPEYRQWFGLGAVITRYLYWMRSRC